MLVESMLDMNNEPSGLRTLHFPHATAHSSWAVELAWHSIHMSMIWLRQIAQLST